MTPDAAADLGRQIEAVEAAASAYDRGATAEASRIAAALRAIFGREGPADGLLARAGGRFARVLTTARKPPAGARHWPALVTWSLRPEHSAFLCEPCLGRPRDGRPVSPSYWWEEEPVYLHDALKFRRRDLVLHAADPSGSALPDRYRAVLDSGSWSATLRPPGGGERVIVVFDGPPAALRQMAHEVLNSPEVRALAGGR